MEWGGGNFKNGPAAVFKGRIRRPAGIASVRPCPWRPGAPIPELFSIPACWAWTEAWEGRGARPGPLLQWNKNVNENL